MASILLKWTLPTVRTSGRPLPIEEIDQALIEISADGGASFGVLGQFKPGDQEVLVPDTEPGTWYFRGTVFDTNGRASAPVVSAPVEVPLPPDTTPPGVLTFEASLVL